MGWPVTNVTKNLLAASSTSVAGVSTDNIVTLSCATLDTARRITVASASRLGPNYTITGLNQYGERITETITTSTTVVSAGTTTQDFLKVTSIIGSCAASTGTPYIVGTSSQGGTPWFTIDTIQNPTNIGFNLVPTSSFTQTSFEYTMDNPYYDPVSNTWSKSAFPTKGPQPTISSLGSSVLGPSATQGSMSTPITAWRITFSSSGSSGTGGTAASVIQSGV